MVQVQEVACVEAVVKIYGIQRDGAGARADQIAQLIRISGSAGHDTRVAAGYLKEFCQRRVDHFRVNAAVKAMRIRTAHLHKALEDRDIFHAGLQGADALERGHDLGGADVYRIGQLLHCPDAAGGGRDFNDGGFPGNYCGG